MPLEQTFYIIRNSDGDTTVTELTKSQLLAELNDPDNSGSEFDALSRDMFLAADSDTNYWGENILIIKGSIMKPKPVQVTTQYTVD